MWTVKLFDNQGNLVAVRQFDSEEAATSWSAGATLDARCYGGQVLVISPDGQFC